MGQIFDPDSKLDLNGHFSQPPFLKQLGEYATEKYDRAIGSLPQTWPMTSAARDVYVTLTGLTPHPHCDNCEHALQVLGVRATCPNRDCPKVT
jgi:hypothetical protein